MLTRLYCSVKVKDFLSNIKRIATALRKQGICICTFPEMENREFTNNKNIFYTGNLTPILGFFLKFKKIKGYTRVLSFCSMKKIQQRLQGKDGEFCLHHSVATLKKINKAI